jgi:Fe-S-cluster containining protein
MITQYVKEEFCLKCQGCCRFPEPDTIWSPGLLEEDRQRLLKNNIPVAFITTENRIRLSYYQRQDYFVCAFFSPQDNKCKIYAFRPFECKLYPFLVNIRRKKVFLAVDIKCPFVKESFKTAKFKKHTKYLAEILNTPAFLAILKKNSQVIQSYPDAIDLRELKI